jgi:cysteine desulfurase/selenocysteine lyase
MEDNCSGQELKQLSVEDVRNDIPLCKKYIYVDNGATTPVPQPIVDAMCEYYEDYCTNIDRGAYSIAEKATFKYENARRNAAEILMNCKMEEFVFTRNLTQCSSIVAYGLEHPLLDTRDGVFGDIKPIVEWKSSDNIVGTIMEHNSNLMPWIRLARRKEIEHRYVYPTDDYVLKPEQFLEQVDSSTRFAAFQHVSNSVGTVHPVKEIIKAIRDVSPDCLIYVDGSQGPGHMPVDVKDLDCDFYGFSGHKGPLGPQGTGGLYIREDIIRDMEPMEVGGGTVADVNPYDYTLRTDFPSRRFDAGTPNIPGLIGLGRAAEYVGKQIGLKKIDQRERMLASKLFEGISHLEDIEIYSPRDKKYRSGVVTFNVKGMNCHDLALYLEEEYNILTRAGAHCCHPLLKHMGIYDKYLGNDRASFSYFNTEEEVKQIIEAFSCLVG